uniref:Phosphotransferase n=1 Tax=Lygus hesperus TaxID=30085 RepID=A0A146LSX2_LYGHE
MKIEELRIQDISPEVRNGCQELNLSDSVLRQCMEKLRAQIDLGLNPSTREQASVKCYNTYVQDLPTGKEKGQFLALDLGGTNFRVLLITLNGRHFDMQSKIYVVPKEIMLGPGEVLFDHIASCLESFALQHRVAKKNLPLGFTFSFPLNQVGLKSGILTRWTKGFNCANTVGEDVVQMLAKALAKRDTIKIDVVAILNDTTGTLMSCAWKNHNCKVGVILGTGSNACYVEKIKNVIGFDGDTSKPHVIINTEWGAFGDHGELDFIRTPYDKEIDKHSVNPGKQLHEKMISGMYLGELARLLIIKFTKDKVLFGGQINPKLQERWSFLTEYISEIENDPRGVFKQCRNVLGKLNILDPTDQDCSNIRYICESVSRRAAYLASAGVATLINKMDIPSVTVGVDGSLYRFHPHFHNIMHEKIPELCNPSIENLCINLMLSEDGSGRGAALIAASGSENNPE